MVRIGARIHASASISRAVLPDRIESHETVGGVVRGHRRRPLCCISHNRDRNCRTRTTFDRMQMQIWTTYTSSTHAMSEIYSPYVRRSSRRQLYTGVVNAFRAHSTQLCDIFPLPCAFRSRFFFAAFGVVALAMRK